MNIFFSGEEQTILWTICIEFKIKKKEEEEGYKAFKSIRNNYLEN